MPAERYNHEPLEVSSDLHHALLALQGDLGLGVAVAERHRLVYANQAYCDLVGYSLPELLALPSVLDITAPDLHDIQQRRLQQRLAGEIVETHYESALIHKSGRRVEVEISVKPFIEHGKLHMVALVRDITERALAARAVRRRDAILQAVGFAAECFLQSADWDARVVDILQALGRAAGAGRVSVYETTLSGAACRHARRYDWIGGPAEPLPSDPDQKSLSWQRWEPLLRAGESVQISWSSANGEEQELLSATGARAILLVPIPCFDKWWGTLLVADLAYERVWAGPEVDVVRAAARIFGAAIQRRTQERALVESEARYRQLFEQNLAGVYRSTVEGRILDCNAAFASIVGYQTREELLNTPAAALYDAPEVRVFFLDRLREAGALTNFESRLRRRDGREVVVLENVSLLPGPAGSGGIIEGTVVDITDRKRLEEQLLQSQKMEAVGKLAGGVAHDFNNLLTAVIGHAGLLSKHIAEDSPARSYLDGIRSAARLASALTGQLLTFSRKRVITPKVFDLNDVVATTESLLSRVIGEDIEFVLALSPEPCEVRAEPTQFEQVLMNLVLNARDAMPAGGRLTIETANAEIDAEESRRLGIPAAPYVRMAVTDTGCGMDEETRKRIFEPFFTTKGTGKGTGLGLPTAYAVVQQAGGQVVVRSEPGAGTTVTVYLPPHTAGQTSECLTRDEADGAETLLLVEDEESLREILADVLRGSGYEVLTARLGADALRAAERHSGTIELLVTDVSLPDLNGLDLAEQLQRARPGMLALFMSGYPRESLVPSLPADAPFLQKPFRTDLLIRAIRQALTSAATGD